MCHCGNSENFESCCGIYLAAQNVSPQCRHLLETPSTALGLMKSRYSAFVEKNFNYLLLTHDPATRDQLDMSANKAWAESVVFTKLEIVSAEETGPRAIVEFIAHYFENKSGRELQHREVSEFNKISGKWYYTKAKI